MILKFLLVRILTLGCQFQSFRVYSINTDTIETLIGQYSEIGRIMTLWKRFHSPSSNINWVLDIGAEDGNWTRALRQYEPFKFSGGFFLIEDNFYTKFPKDRLLETSSFFTSVRLGDKDGHQHYDHTVDDEQICQCIFLSEDNSLGDSEELLSQDTTATSTQQEQYHKSALSNDSSTRHVATVDFTVSPFVKSFSIIRFNTRGRELAILKGAEKTLSVGSPLVMTSIWNMQCYSTAIATFGEISEWMTSHGFKMVDILNEKYGTFHTAAQLGNTLPILLKWDVVWVRNDHVLAQTSPREIVNNRYITSRSICYDICEHLPTLYEYSKRVQSIIELGVSMVCSSWALSLGLIDNKSDRKILHSVDIEEHHTVADLRQLTKANKITFNFTLGSDLTVQLPHAYDLVFIDTWHIYGQLKRELSRYAPYTHSWIVMHDTEVDGVRGESLRSGHDIAKMSLMSGFPVDDISKGLSPAIDEFLAKNRQWEIELVHTNNNGLTILRRREQTIDSLLAECHESGGLKRPLFMLTSVVDLPQSIMNRYSTSARFNQTVISVQSILQRVPNAIIVVIDGSSNPTPIPDATLYYRYNLQSHFDIKITPYFAVTKSIAETFMLEEFLRSPLFERLSPIINMVFKISGRYYLTDTFKYKAFKPGHFNAASVHDSSSINEDKLNYHTALYAFDIALTPIFLDLLTYAQTRLLRFGGSVEASLFHKLVVGPQRHLMNDMGTVGLNGFTAPYGNFAAQ